MSYERELQLQREVAADAAAQKQAVRSLIERAKAGGIQHPRASAIVKSVLDNVVIELDLIKDDASRGIGGLYKNWMRAASSEVQALISIRECIRACSRVDKDPTVSSLCGDIGTLFELEVRIDEASQIDGLYIDRRMLNMQKLVQNQGDRKRLIKKAIEHVLQGHGKEFLNTSERAHLGKFGLNACINAGLVFVRKEHGKGRVRSVVYLDPEVKEFLLDYTEHDVRRLISREDSRMQCPPDEWTNLVDGGYLSARRKITAPLMKIQRMRRDQRDVLLEKFTAEKMPMVFECANYLQSIAYTIHEPTRSLVARVFEQGGGTLGVPLRNAPVAPPYPAPDRWYDLPNADEHKAAVDAWRLQKRLWHEAERERRGHLQEIGLFLRSTGKNTERFWYPVQFDTRGRWYYQGVPNPQGSDMARACLHFADKKPLGERGVYWLQVAIANHFGFDKVRLDERAAWTQQNWPRIEKALDEPENHPEVWGTDAPVSMFSACWELREAYRSGNPSTYETGIPVHIDATCSGLQHFAAMLRDSVGGQYVNLTDPLRCGPKADVYSRVAALATELMHQDVQSGNEKTKRLAGWWIKRGITRNMAKRPTMTYVYGGTLHGLSGYLEQEMIQSIPNTELAGDLGYKVLSKYATRKLFEGLRLAVPAADECMRWLRGVASQVGKDKRMEWTTPTGFLVQHDYMQYSEKRVRIKSCGVSMITVYNETDTVRRTKMVNAIAPNFVHAMDASHLTMVANACKRKGLAFVGIHDSFGTHACDMDTLARITRQQFVELYSGNPLAEFAFEVGYVGETPVRGTLDLNEVLDSEFFFC